LEVFDEGVNGKRRGKCAHLAEEHCSRW
jgi:hypothetical protein